MTLPWLMSVDPGVLYFAGATWVGGELRETRIFDYDLVGDGNSTPAAIERPRIMLGRNVRARDVEGVLIGYGKLTRIYPNHKDFSPHCVPEKIWHARIMGLLTESERAIVMQRSAKERKHTIDAVGIGLQYLGRM